MGRHSAAHSVTVYALADTRTSRTPWRESLSSDRSRPTVPGVRSTRQRAAVAALLEERRDFRSTQDLFEELRSRGEDVGLTTVYRTLQSLADAGEVDVLRIDSGEAYYRRCSAGHHHHLVCRDCGRTVEVAGPTVENWATKIATQHGFVDVDHSLEIFGRCATCTG